MDENIFTACDAVIAKVGGSKDPRDIANGNRSKILIGTPLSGTIMGMSCRIATLGVIAVNRELDEVWT